MKKKVVCIFSFILLVLVTCTILSRKIEDEMTLEVIGWNVKSSFSNVDIPSALLFSDEYGLHAYEVFEGKGWESGLRTRELGGTSILSDRDYIIVRGASRQPSYGDFTILHDGSETAPSTYLAVYPGGIPEENKLLFQAQILEKSENVLLLYMERGIQPFTENRTKNGMIQLEMPGWRVYSLDALNQLLENVPMAVIALLIVAALAVFGVHTVLLAMRSEPHRLLVLGHAVLLGALLIALQRILGQIDLPPSMLPPENIFRVSYYRSVCAEMFQALEALASETTRTYQALRAQALHEAMLSVSIGSAVILLLPVSQLLWIRSRRKIQP